MKTSIYNNLKKYLGAAAVALVIFSGCSKDTSSPNMSADSNAPGSGSGKGGSMARFAISGDYLYTVDNTTLKVFDVSTPSAPQWVNDVATGTGIETIFTRGDKNLFIGSELGMYIFSIQTPAEPQHLSTYTHVLSCDPLVADERYAYVTLRTESRRCNRGVNELQILDIQDLTNPRLIRSYGMTAPMGLGIDGDHLFVCDAGLKLYDANDPLNINLLKHYEEFNATDVIPNNGNLMVIGADGLYQYSYANGDMTQLSRIPVIQK